MPAVDRGCLCIAFGLMLAIASFVPGVRAVRAQAAPDTSEWRCSLCPFERGVEAETTTGATYVSDSAARFGNGNGYNERGGYLLAESRGRFSNEHQRIVWRARELGVDARSLSLDGSRGGALGYRLRYRELPYYLYDSTATVFRPAPGERLALPPGWARAPSTSQMVSLDSSLLPRNIDSGRDTLGLAIRLRPSRQVGVYADYDRQEVDGTTIAGASFIHTASQVPRPVDQFIDEFAAGVRYRMNSGMIEFGYRGSFFDNRLSALSWDDPFTSPSAAGIGTRAEPPDNSYQNVTLRGAFRFPAATALTFAVGVGHGEQDEALLPYTTNLQLGTSPLPRATLDGAVDTSHAAVTLSARPWSRLELRASYRYDERDNRTPVAAWNPVITDLFNSAVPENNVAYDFTRDRLDVGADADVSKRLRLSAGYEYTGLDRSAQEVTGQTTNGGWGRARWRIRPGFELSARHGTERRDIDRYDTSLAMELRQNPLLAKYNLAYRFRSYTDVSFMASGSVRPYSLSVSARSADDDYTRSRLGLTNDDERRLAVDVGWTFTPNVSVFASLSDETIDARQLGSEAFAEPDWTAQHEDRFRTLSGGVKLDQVLPRLDLTVDVSVTDGSTEISVVSGSDNGAFPELVSELDALRLRARYRQSSHLDVLMDLRYERLTTEDWALAGVGPATIPELLALGADPFRYRVLVLRAGVTYRWGGQGASTALR